MKHLIFAAIMLLASLQSFSQSFDGVSISGGYYEAVEKYKSKGYKVVQTGNTYTYLSGSVNGTSVELLVMGTPKTKQFCKAIIYLPKRTSWSSLKSNYEDYLQILTNKYGNPSSSYNFFKDPYNEGDGYELSAVKADKCVFAAYWIDSVSNTNIALNISEYLQVQISYENDRLMDVLKKEKDILNGNSF